jgi:hypothetical protein
MVSSNSSGRGVGEGTRERIAVRDTPSSASLTVMDNTRPVAVR